jgi:hypothetical protein
MSDEARLKIREHQRDNLIRWAIIYHQCSEDEAALIAERCLVAKPLPKETNP